MDESAIPHWHVPTHVMEIAHQIEAGSIRFLWVICTNPAVSLPDLERVRALLSKPGLFLVVSDCFMTETAALADVVLPAGARVHVCASLFYALPAAARLL